MKTIQEILLNLKQKFPKAKGNFIYRDKFNARKKYKTIMTYWLLYSEVHGYFVMDVQFKRTKPPKTVADWQQWLGDKSEPSGGLYIFTEKILEPQNIRKELDYTLVRLLAWRTNDDLPPSRGSERSGKNTAKQKGSNK